MELIVMTVGSSHHSSDNQDRSVMIAID